MIFTVAFATLAVLVRFATLAISIRNERRLKADGAVEHGALVSALLAGAHVGFYLAAIAEGVLRHAPLSAVTVAGVVIYALAIGMLIHVIQTLGRLWTVKLIIARDHTLTSSRLFRWVRHPNYFLNIIPELIGVALALQAFATLVWGLPVYLVILGLRIHQEEKLMRARFPDY